MGFSFYIIGNFDKFPIIQKALRAGCTRRNKEILPLCGIAAARKVGKPLKIEGLAHFVLDFLFPYT